MFNSVSEKEIGDIIQKLPNKSCTLDVLPTWLLKSCADEVVSTFTEIVNVSLAQGSFPTALKKAVVTPVIKKQSLDPNDLKHYRPVSNIKTFSKIIEKTVTAQLESHLESNDMNDSYQSAYRPKHGTETALLKVKNDITNAMDDQKVTILVMLDLSSAFDTIDYTIMLDRLTKDFNITDTALTWISSYLQDRTYRVLICGTESKEHTMFYGIPQGSVMGPGLFTKYTYPIGKIIQEHGLKYHIYADDTQIYISFNPRVPGDAAVAIFKLTECIESIKKWMDENKLKLNKTKTELFVAGSKPTLKLLEDISLDICGASILPSVKVRNLGVYFDSNMTMSDHISTLSSSLNYQLRNLSRIRKYIDKDTCHHAIRSLITQRLDNSNSLLYGITSKDMDRLQKIQNRAARLIFQVSRFEHTSRLIRELHWLPIKERIVYKILLLVYKSLNELAPSYLSNMLSYATPAPSEDMMCLRSHTDTTRLTCNRTRTTFGDNSFINCAPQLWNQLTSDIRSSATINAFKSSLKTHLYKF